MTTTPKTQDELLVQAQARVSHHSDIPTTFFIQITPALEGSANAELEKVKNDMTTWQSYLSALAGIKVQEMINAGELPRTIDPAANAVRSMYKTQVFAQMLRGISRPWLRQKHAEQERKGVSSCSVGELHSQLVAKIVDGFACTNRAVGLERSLKTVSGNIDKVAATNSSQTTQCLFVLIRFDSKKSSVAPVVRIVNLETAPESSDPGRLSFNCKQSESDFDTNIFSQIASAFPENIIKGGRGFITQATEQDVMVAAT